MSRPSIANPICVALDSDERERVLGLARATAPYVGLLKVGLTAFVAHGHALVRELTELRPVFLDLKLHDIPVQVAGAMRGVRDCGAGFVTVHASGGQEMIRAAVDTAGPTRVLAVTVLTSLDHAALMALGMNFEPRELVTSLAAAALDAGAYGLVCSPQEVALLRSRFGTRDEGGPLLVVPGIRAGEPAGDQKRTASATEALAAGADILVVGRPITEAADPAAAARLLAALAA